MKVLDELTIKYGDKFMVLLGHPGNQYWSKIKVWTKSSGPNEKGMLMAIKQGQIKG